MQYLSLDVLQDDCPLTEVTRSHDVTCTTPYWRFIEELGQWELRVHVEAPDGPELEAGLERLRDDDAMRRFELRRKADSTAFVRVAFEETAAIGTVSRHDGYVIGPFHNTDGCERWHLGFDTRIDAENALSDLDRHEECIVRKQCRLDTALEYDPIRYYETANALLESCRQLTEREYVVLQTAVEMGYYETPRESTLTSIGEQLGVSDVAVSKTLRRGERKLLESGVAASGTVRSS